MVEQAGVVAAHRAPTPVRVRSAVPAGCAALAVLAQIAYPLLDGQPAASNPALVAVTAAGVMLFAAASITHAATTLGARAALALVVVAGGLGLVAEAVGVATGVPFGRYAYAGTLGPQLLGVPLLVPLAWTMMAYPCLLAGRSLRRGGRGRRAVPVLAAGWLLAAWDVFLDPQMVAAGHWRWAHPDPALPGVAGIPLTNFAGWLLVALAMQAVLHRVLPERSDQPVAVPAALLAWTWLGSTLANLAFFDRPLVAVYGLVAMGVVAAPALLGWVRRASARQR